MAAITARTNETGHTHTLTHNNYSNNNNKLIKPPDEQVNKMSSKLKVD